MTPETADWLVSVVFNTAFAFLLSVFIIGFVIRITMWIIFDIIKKWKERKREYDEDEIDTAHGLK